MDVGRRNTECAEHLCAELQSIADAWYTRNKWPRGRVAYTKLFLPVVHIAIAIGFTADHLFGKLHLSSMQSMGMDVVEGSSGPLRAWPGQSAMQTLLHVAGIPLTDILQGYGFYIIFVPVFFSMMVRPCLLLELVLRFVPSL
jgi:hypothetical protein